MAIEFRTVEILFKEATKKDNKESRSVTFDSRVNAADAAIKAFELGYTEGDHELKLERVEITNVKTLSKEVSFDVIVGLRDDSGRYDDPYEGRVAVLVFADLAGGD